MTQEADQNEKRNNWLSRVVYRGDQSYPGPLDQFVPPSGYYSGDGLWYNSEPIPSQFEMVGGYRNDLCPPVFICGARDASDAGKEVAGRIAAELAKMEFPVVVGFAHGIDMKVVQYAVANNGVVYAVLGGPIIPVPPRSLLERLVSTGAMMTSFQKALKSNFPKRNQQMIGMTGLVEEGNGIVIVIEGAEGSGTHGAALFARAAGKRLFVVKSNRIVGATSFLMQEMQTWGGVQALENTSQLRSAL